MFPGVAHFYPNLLLKNAEKLSSFIYELKISPGFIDFGLNFNQISLNSLNIQHKPIRFCKAIIGNLKSFPEKINSAILQKF